MQPAVSPDGLTLAYVSPVPGKLGTGGIWTRPLAGGAATLVHYEESEYRMSPHWTPDGKALLYGSDETGSNDIAIVPAAGGNPFVFTNDPMGEFSPARRPTARRFAFVSNRTGPMTLISRRSAAARWLVARRDDDVARAPSPTGRVRARVVGPTARRCPRASTSKASDGRAYAPDGGFARVIAVTETHYFHTTGAFELDVPAGPLAIEALRGFEYRPATTTVDVKAGATHEVDAELGGSIDAPAQGWYGGDTHAHDLHQGVRADARDPLRAVAGRRPHVTNALIHMDGTRLMGRWADLTGKPHPLSTPTHILQFAEEFRGSLGHIGMIGISATCCRSPAARTHGVRAARERRAVPRRRARAGRHRRLHASVHARVAESARQSCAVGCSLIPVDVALGKGTSTMSRACSPTSWARRSCTTGCSTAASGCRRPAARTTFRTSGAIRRRAPIARTPT